MSDKQFKWPEKERLVYLRPPKEEYHGSLPSFYPPDLFPELNALKENWKAIRDEIIAYEEKRGAISGMGSYSPAAVSGDWSTINLMSYMILFHKNRKKFPVLCSIADKIPTCTTVTISVLSPHTQIKPHFGDTNGVIRAHLGLIVPDSYPTIGMKVGNEDTGWKDGELLLFTIVKQHSVWSNSSKRRYVLIIDFVPKTLEKRQKEICIKTLGSQTYIFLYKRISFLKFQPDFIANFLCFVFSIFWMFALPIQRKIKFGSVI